MLYLKPEEQKQNRSLNTEQPRQNNSLFRSLRKACNDGTWQTLPGREFTVLCALLLLKKIT